MKKTSNLFILLAIVIVTLSNTMVSDNGRAGVSGSPGETTCNTAGCHTGTSANVSSVLTTNIPATGYVPGATYNISLTVSETGKSLFGLGVEALNAANGNTGTLVITNAASTQIKSKTINGVSRKNVVHQNNGGIGTGTKTFNFNWIAPATADGVVTFYYAGLAANGNGNEDSGDNTAAGFLSFSPQTTVAISATASSTSVTCFGESNGSCTAIATGGSNYTYSWSNGMTTATINNLSVGTYVVTISSGASSATASATVSQPTQIVTTINTPNVITCTTPSVTLSASATGGTPPYTYSIPANGTIPTPGTYVVSVTDALGCTSASSATVISNTIAPNAMVVVPGQLCSNSNLILSSAGSSSGPNYVNSWIGGSITTSGTVSSPGTYTLLVTDIVNGCTSSALGTVVASNLNISNAQIFNTTTGGDNGAISITVDGGVAPFSFLWKNEAGTVIATSQDVNNLPNGNYNVTVMDASGCSSTLNNLLILTSATNTSESFGIKVNPNPANEKLQIDLGIINADKIVLYNFNGIEVWKIGASAGNLSISLPEVKAGMYMLAIHTADKLLVKKIFILK